MGGESVGCPKVRLHTLWRALWRDRQCSGRSGRSSIKVGMKRTQAATPQISALSGGAVSGGDKSPDDLSQLGKLEEVSVRDALRSRFDQRKIYTHINSLLVAVNPYEQLDIYGDEMLQAYAQYGVQTPGPHVFGMAAAAYRGLLDARSQSVIISGESGAQLLAMIALPVRASLGSACIELLDRSVCVCALS